MYFFLFIAIYGICLNKHLHQSAVIIVSNWVNFSKIQIHDWKNFTFGFTTASQQIKVQDPWWDQNVIRRTTCTNRSRSISQPRPRMAPYTFKHAQEILCNTVLYLSRFRIVRSFPFNCPRPIFSVICHMEISLLYSEALLFLFWSCDYLYDKSFYDTVLQWNRLGKEKILCFVEQYFIDFCFYPSRNLFKNYSVLIILIVFAKHFIHIHHKMLTLEKKTLQKQFVSFSL